MKYLIALLVGLSIANNIFAQETTKNGTPSTERFGFVAGYFGDKLAHHGYTNGMENYLATTKNFRVVGAIQFINYFAKQNFTAISISPRIGFRYTTNFGLFLENSLGLGYLHRFYRFNQFEVDAQGQVVSKSKASQASVMPSISLGAGYDFRSKTKLPILYFLRTSVNFNYPNKHFIFEASYALETGFIYVPKIEKKKFRSENTSP